MSNEEKIILDSIENRDLRTIVRKALGKGFQPGPWTSPLQASVVWPDTGDKVGLHTDSTNEHYWKDFARQCETVSGITLIDKPRRPRRNTVRLTSQVRPDHEVRATFRPPPMKVDHWTGRVEEMVKEYRTLDLELRTISLPGDSAPEEYTRIKEIVLRMHAIEQVFAELHHPIPVTPVAHTRELRRAQ